MTQDKARKTAARQRAAETGESYTRAARLANQPGDRRSAGFDPDAGIQPQRWEQLIEWLDQAEARLDHADPYARQAAFDGRARVYHQLYAQTTDPVYAAACVRAALLDEATAARIRFEHGIPTLRPRSEATLLGLHTCSWCGRPWQVDPTGACEHCPRLRFGPPPATAAEAARLPRPQTVTRADLTDPVSVDD